MTHNRLVNCFQRAGLELAQRVANPPGAEVGRLLPVPDAQQSSQTAMVLGLILQLVEIIVQAQSHRRQDDNLPIIQSRTTHIATRVLIDIFRDQLHQFACEADREV